MLRLANNDAGANDRALALKVEAGEALLSVNSDEVVSSLNADQVDGFHAGCATGQRLIGGLCYDESPQTASTLGNAGNACEDLGGQLPGAMQLRGIRSEPGIDLGTASWSADVQFVGTATPPNDFHGVIVTDTGGVALRDDQEDNPFRCVYQPLTPE